MQIRLIDSRFMYACDVCERYLFTNSNSTPHDKSSSKKKKNVILCQLCDK